MKKCFSFLLVLTLMLAVCAAASAETITLKIAHNYYFVTIPNSVIAAADRLNERYAAEGKNINRCVATMQPWEEPAEEEKTEDTEETAE